jgi:hypothetical protein
MPLKCREKTWVLRHGGGAHKLFVALGPQPEPTHRNTGAAQRLQPALHLPATKAWVALRLWVLPRTVDIMMLLRNYIAAPIRMRLLLINLHSNLMVTCLWWLMDVALNGWMVLFQRPAPTLPCSDSTARWIWPSSPLASACDAREQNRGVMRVPVTQGNNACPPWRVPPPAPPGSHISIITIYGHICYDKTCPSSTGKSM